MVDSTEKKWLTHSLCPIFKTWTGCLSLSLLGVVITNLAYNLFAVVGIMDIWSEYMVRIGQQHFDDRWQNMREEDNSAKIGQHE